MNPFIKYLLRRILYMLITILLITASIFSAFIWLLPPEVRAFVYLPPWKGVTPDNYLETVITEYGMRDPLPVQYGRWLINLARGDWGMSPTMNTGVLDILIQRAPATVELLLFSLIFFIPTGLVSGVIAGWRRGKLFDSGFRLTAFIATSIPPFILGLMLLAIFYIGLNWFPAGRVSVPIGLEVSDPSFRSYTGLIVLDGVLNGRLDVSADALRHLVLPAFTVSLTYWATLGRITRAAINDELHEDYINTARSKGLHNRDVLWRHAFRNASVPGLNSIALSAAMFLTNAMIIEIIFGYPGISKPLSQALANPKSPDIYMAMGFAVFSTLLVLPVMLALDILLAVFDPRIREGVS
jgi:peptide/nickel transport system permease protein